MIEKRYIQMNRNEFTTNYTIIKNPFSDLASKDDICFAPEGEELGFVRCHDPACVWTLVIGYDGGVWLYSGYHYDDRLGFILTKEPFPSNTRTEVKWAEPKRTMHLAAA
ncbi:MAG: hypothetical protein JNK00_00360 [Flavipsychrobacter sp.]|nr:hypothetical protein [Flavipsychrobacter sp.]